MADGSRMWLAVPVLGVALAAALFAVFGGGPSPVAPTAPTSPAVAATAKAKATGSAPTGGPGAGAANTPAGDAPAGDGALTPEQRRQRMQALLHGERAQLPGGGAPMGALEGDRVGVRGHVDRRADEVVRQIEGAVEAAKVKGKWDDRTTGAVDAVLDRLDNDVAALQKQVTAGSLDAASAMQQMDQLGRDAATEIAKATDVPVEDLTKPAGIAPPPTPEQEADAIWWEGIPFEQWAAEEEAKMKAGGK